MRDMLAEQYELVLENQMKGTVDTPGMAKPGQSMLDKDTREAAGRGVNSPAAKSVGSPEEMDKKLNPGHGKIMKERDMDEMLPESSFDKLFKATLIEEELGDDESPLEQTGGDEFNDEMGDFPPDGEGEDDLGEEVDVATELRMIIDRLTEIAEKLGAFDEESAETDEEGFGEEGMDGDFGDEEPVVPEAVTYGKGGGGKAGGPGKGSDGKLSAFPDRTSQMQSKSSQKVKHSAVTSKQTAAGKASPGGPGKGSTGKLGSFPDRASQMQSKGNQVVKSEMGKAGRSVFD